MLIVKPRIKRNRRGDEWLCYGGDSIGWGLTPTLAYELWLSRFRRACPLYPTERI